MSEPAARRFVPWVTIFLAVANVAVFGIEVAAGGDLLWGPTPARAFELGANYGPATLGGEPWRLVSSMFLHFGILHLAMNMFMGLYQLGQHVERMFGRAGYAAIYLVAGLTGSLASAARGSAVSAGASGAIFGLIGAFAAFLLVHRKRLDPVAVKKQAANLGMLLAINIMLGLRVKGIDMLAHGGGLVGGFVAALALAAGANADRQYRVRAILTAVLGTAVTVGATFVLPSPADNVLERFRGVGAFTPFEQRALDRWNAMVKDIQAGQPPSDAAIADAIEQQILPTWRDGRAAYARAGGKDANMLLYIEIRDDAWATMLHGLRAGDTTEVERGATRMREADELLRKMSN